VGRRRSCRCRPVLYSSDEDASDDIQDSRGDAVANDACTSLFPSLTDLEEENDQVADTDGSGRGEELVADDGVTGESSIIHIDDSDNDCPGSPVRPSSYRPFSFYSDAMLTRCKNRAFMQQQILYGHG